MIRDVTCWKLYFPPRVLQELQGYRDFKVSRDQQAFLVSQVSEGYQEHRGSRYELPKYCFTKILQFWNIYNKTPQYLPTGRGWRSWSAWQSGKGGAKGQSCSVLRALRFLKLSVIFSNVICPSWFYWRVAKVLKASLESLVLEAWR